MNFMEYDSTLSSVISRTVDLIILSILWFLCSIPLITIGASTAALYYATVKSVRKKRGYVVRNFFHSFRINLKQGIILSAVGGIILIVLYSCFLFAAQIPDRNLAFFAETIYLCITFVSFGTMCMAIPVLSRCTIKTSRIIRFSFGLMVRHFPYVACIVLIAAAAIFLIWFIPVLVFCIPAVAELLCSLPVEHILRIYTPEEESGWYSEP